MEEEPVGDDADVGCRPVSPNQRHEFGQTGMNGRLAAEQIELCHSNPIAPGGHPAIRQRRVQVAAVAMVGIMTAAIASQIAGVGHMQFQPVEWPRRSKRYRFGAANPQGSPQIREKFHDEGPFRIRRSTGAGNQTLSGQMAAGHLTYLPAIKSTHWGTSAGGLSLLSALTWMTSC